MEKFTIRLLVREEDPAAFGADGWMALDFTILVIFVLYSYQLTSSQLVK